MDRDPNEFTRNSLRALPATSTVTGTVAPGLIVPPAGGFLILKPSGNSGVRVSAGINVTVTVSMETGEGVILVVEPVLGGMYTVLVTLKVAVSVVVLIMLPGVQAATEALLTSNQLATSELSVMLGAVAFTKTVANSPVPPAFSPPQEVNAARAQMPRTNLSNFFRMKSPYL
uniref:Uncharacterized protein n=1 Tax=Geoanaerobacter pelophilus TaxID=60036 RepID=A0ABQ0MFR7_9BACT|nr:hypothetical protein GPEL0_01r0803 [Geoanaerobacter pelophilus]